MPYVLDVSVMFTPSPPSFHLPFENYSVGSHAENITLYDPWDEESLAAAKKIMAEDRSGPAENISLSELTLVTSAPSTHIAASSRSAPSAMPAASPKSPDGAEAKLDIEKIANDVYKEILVIMDATRARNGEPYP